MHSHDECKVEDEVQDLALEDNLDCDQPEQNLFWPANHTHILDHHLQAVSGASDQEDHGSKEGSLNGATHPEEPGSMLLNEMCMAWQAHLQQHLHFRVHETSTLTDSGVLALTILHVSTNTSIRCLNLSPARKLPPGSGAVISSLFHSKSTHLEALNLMGNGLSGEARYVSEALAHNDSLRHLNLCHNGIDGDVAASFIFKTGLVSLFLPVNSLGDAGASTIGQSLACNTTLRTLDISACEISADGFRSLGLGLRTNATLETLSLSHNSQIIKGINAESLASNRLRTISLSHCHLFDEDGCIVADALKLKTCTWHKLDLANNR